MKLSLNNKTKWNTKQLRKLCIAVIRHSGSHKHHQITIKTSKNQGLSGLASMYGSWILMRVPKTSFITAVARYSTTETTIGSDGKTYPEVLGFDKIVKETKFPVIDFAQVLEHEIGHNLGLRHNDMSKVYDLDTSYLKDFVIEKQLPKEKKVIDHVMLRREKAVKKVKELQSRLKRTETLLKKWSKRLRYYEK